MCTLPRHRPRQCPVLIAGLVLSVALLPDQLRAQDRPSSRAVAVVAGPANYDLSGTGWSWSAAGRLDLPLGRVLVLEPGIGFFTYDPQFGSRSWLLLPEVSLHLQYPAHGVRPYLGVGAGGAFALQGPGTTEPSVHAALGLRLDMNPRWGLRAEARARNLSVFEANNSILEFVAGYSQRF